MKESKGAQWWVRAVVQSLIALAASASLVVATNAIAKLNEIDRRVTVVESSRFTSEHGAQVWREIAAIREQIASLPKETPPSWFKERVDRLESELKTEIKQLHQEIQAIQR